MATDTPLILYGGTFDPPHFGHKKIAEYVTQKVPYEKMFIVPAFSPPHKFEQKTTPFQDRLKMLQLLFDDVVLPEVEISPMEKGLPEPSYTWRTLEYMEKQYPGKKISIVLGNDMYNQLPTWNNYELLRKKYSFIVLDRSLGSTEKDGHEKDVFLQNPKWDTSSQVIRAAYKTYYQTREMPEVIKKWIPPTIHDYICNHNLYSDQSS
ncbi:MAG: nicotinate (nicotinamide) nucleotide adenylyltransferase [Leptospirales bacterium]